MRGQTLTSNSSNYERTKDRPRLNDTMHNKLLKCLVDFYSRLAITEDKWREFSRIVQRTLDSLKYKTEQLRKVTSSELDNADLCCIEGLRERLVFKIFAGIEEEVDRFRETLLQLNNSTKDLKNKLKNLESARDKVSLEDESMKELVNGTPYRPTLNLLLEWAIDAYDYFHKLYCDISDSLKAVDYKDEESIEKLAESLVEDELPRIKIDRILAHTQFLVRQTSSR